MKEWLIAITIALPLWIALPFLIARTKRHHRGKKGGSNLGSALEAGFGVYDPAKARAIEVMNIHQEIGHAHKGNQGEHFDHHHDSDY